MRYYKTRSWGFKIEPAEVEKISEHFVWIEGRRNSIKDYFPTWDEAKQSLIAREQRRVETLERQLRDAKDDLFEAESLKPEA